MAGYYTHAGLIRALTESLERHPELADVPITVEVRLGKRTVTLTTVSSIGAYGRGDGTMQASTLCCSLMET